ncbi:serine hydrolase domain-containing protein [Streptomyces sp. NPDC001941]|uniref:serine hydrolase domain-containing protein n=1 Tax=Streptomyces sp. NPDC001941 TaxID=3154659 RepID=UPI0033319DDF
MSVRTVRPVRTALAATAVAAALAVTALPSTASAATHGGGGHAGTQRALDAAVAAGVPGALASARLGDRTWYGEAGVADLRTGRERGARDRFRVGSITKTFTATVLLQLQAEGRLDLDDTVDHWLPGVVTGNGNDGRAITVRQLLNHTSGIYNYTEDPGFQEKVFGPGFLRHRYDTWTPGQLVGVALAHAPEFTPGSRWQYSNTNYVLAGMVIRKVTGRPYGEEVERRVLKPLHLTGTSVPGTRSALPAPSGRAYSKLSREATGPTYDVTALNPSAASAAGEMVSTTSDLQTFYRALLRGTLLPAAQLKEMKRTVAVDPSVTNIRYGLGLMWQKLDCGTEVWGHSGGIHGSTSNAVTTADGAHSLASNFNGDWAGDEQALADAEFCGSGR